MSFWKIHYKRNFSVILDGKDCGMIVSCPCECNFDTGCPVCPCSADGRPTVATTSTQAASVTTASTTTISQSATTARATITIQSNTIAKTIQSSKLFSQAAPAIDAGVGGVIYRVVFGKDDCVIGDVCPY